MFFMSTTDHRHKTERRLQLVVAVPAKSSIFVFGEHEADKDPENSYLSVEVHR
jgi:hypothetical protein